MKKYIYPKNLKSATLLWFWQLKDVLIIGAAFIISVILLSITKSMLFLALTAGYAFITITVDGNRIYDFIVYAARFFGGQQRYDWR